MRTIRSGLFIPHHAVLQSRLHSGSRVRGEGGETPRVHISTTAIDVGRSRLDILWEPWREEGWRRTVEDAAHDLVQRGIQGSSLTPFREGCVHVAGEGSDSCMTAHQKQRHEMHLSIRLEWTLTYHLFGPTHLEVSSGVGPVEPNLVQKPLP